MSDPVGEKDRVPLGLDPSRGFEVTFEAEAETVEGARKVGRVRHFTVESDEPPVAGGTDTAPSPMAYLTVATGF